MGTCSSSLFELKDNTYLQRFSGEESISYNDPFWNQLLSFTFVPPHTREDSLFLEGSIAPMLNKLLNNNPVTGNVVALTKIFLLHASELKAAVQCDNTVFIWQAHNSLFILRCVLKYLIETLGEEGMMKHLEEPQAHLNTSLSDPEKLLEDLVQTLFNILTEIDLDNKTYGILLETVNALIVLLSVQMFSSRPSHLSIVYSIVMGSISVQPSLVIKNLLQFYYSKKMCPHCLNSNSGAGLISGLASSLWNMFSAQSTQSKDVTNSILSNQSLLLLLTLIYHCSNACEMTNPFRSVLFHLEDSKSNAESEEDSAKVKIDLETLFSTLCSTLKDDQNALLVYTLLHQNKNFNNYVIFSSSVGELIIPLLKLLYNAPDENSHLIYMSLIMLLILSEEEHFSKSIHSIKLKAVMWYSERFLSEITLGSLTILVLVRTIQFNMTRMHDKYLHTNCLAALANMSACIYDLHPYVCQKFISLIENLGKRYVRVLCQSKNMPGHQENDSASPPDLIQDLSILEEVIRMLLEILNSCLTAQFHNNNDLLYTILHKKDIFCMFRSIASFQDVMQNIDAVLLFFTEKLESLEHNLSVAEVSEFIKTVSSQWSSEKMKKLPELKFKYVEEGQPEDFFIPYLWSIIFHSSSIHWDSKNILIFNPNKSV